MSFVNKDLKDISITTRQIFLIEKLTFNIDYFSDYFDNDERFVDTLTSIKEHLISLSMEDFEKAIIQSEEDTKKFINTNFLPFETNLINLSTRIDELSPDNKEEKIYLLKIKKEYSFLREKYLEKEKELNKPGSSFHIKRNLDKLYNELEKTENNYKDTPHEKKEFIREDLLNLKKEIALKESLYEKQLKIEYDLKVEKSQKELFKERITSAINTLNTLIDKKSSLSKHKNYLECVRIIFNAVSVLFFVVSIVFFYFNFNYLFTYPLSYLQSDIKFINYILFTSPIIVPAVLGLVFLRQSNIKSKEIYEITKRFILIEEVNRSLNALIDISELKDLNSKTQQVIEKLIENIFDYTITVEETNTNSKLDLLELNFKLDKLVDTIDKKKMANESLGNLK